MLEEEECPCCLPGANARQFRNWRTLPRDETECRFADVEINQCVQCGRLWLRYAVEYEAFSESGRWARGLIDRELAASIKPEEAADYLAVIPQYVFGGSFYRRPGIGWGPLRWSLA